MMEIWGFQNEPLVKAVPNMNDGGGAGGKKEC